MPDRDRPGTSEGVASSSLYSMLNPAPSSQPGVIARSGGIQQVEGEAAETENTEPEEEESEEIETDRDSFTPATSTVSPGRLVVEAAYSYIDNRDVPETHSFPELLVRYGVSDLLEMRLGWNYEIGGAGSPISGNVPGGLDEVSTDLEEEARVVYGTKVFLTRQCGGVPESSWIVQGFTPTQGESNHSELSSTYVFGWELPSGSVLDFGLRYGTGRDEQDEFNVWAPSTVFKVPLGERWKVHAEYFGVMSDGRDSETTQHFFSPGAHYLINENFEIGLRVGWGLSDQSPNFFANAGIGLQF